VCNIYANYATYARFIFIYCVSTCVICGKLYIAPCVAMAHFA
jgi:hypothetical protein